MLNLQRLLQKKKDQNTAENTSRAKKARARRTMALSMAAISVIPFLAPPVGTERSVFALAAAAGSADGLLEVQAERAALIAAVIQENEEAAKAAEAASADNNARFDFCREAAEHVKQTWKAMAENIYENVFAEAEEELQLLGLSEQEGLSEGDVVADGDTAADGADYNAGGDAAVRKDAPALDEFTEIYEETEKEKEIPSAEEVFFSGVDYDSIPEALSISYNADYAALKLSAEQLTVLETIVEAEAGDEDVYGKILVANVVLNRVLDDEFPDTVKEVVFQSNGKTYQFSPVRKGGRYYTVTVSEHTRAAVARALAGEDYSDGALYFFARRYTTAKKAKWFDTSLRKIVEYGCHEFFGNK